MSDEKPTLERQTSESLSIPERRVVVKDASELPTSYSTTPGGTMFSTTPGGIKGQGLYSRSVAGGLIAAHHAGGITVYYTCTCIARCSIVSGEM